MSKTFNVSYYCITNTDIILLEFLVSVLNKTAAIKCELSNGTQGELVIIDTDTQAGVDKYQKVLTDKHPPICITYSSKNDTSRSRLHLNKPMRSSDFISLFKEILDKHPELGKETNNPIKFTDCKEKDDGNIANSESITPVQKTFNIKHPYKKRLYNLLTDKTYKQPLKITYKDSCIFIDFKNNTYIYQKKLSDLTKLSTLHIESLEIDDVPYDEYNALLSMIEARPLSELIWFSALLGSNGELNESINDNTLLHLNQWPNFIALTHSPQHIKLAAYMSKNTCSLEDIYIQTNINSDDIINFVNANYVMGYLDIDNKKDSVKNIKFKKNTEKVELFDNLRHKLSKYTSD